MNSDLLRQRRNLMIISSGLLLFDFANVTIAKVSILGTELFIGNAQILVYYAWLLWGYFLLRYYQYLKIETGPGISDSLNSRVAGEARACVFRKINKTQFSGNIDLKRNGLRLGYSIMEYLPDIGDTREIESGVLPPLKVGWWIAKSWLCIAAHTPKVTDHVLPFLLAAAAPLASIISS